jgi:hypothetical protein
MSRFTRVVALAAALLFMGSGMAAAGLLIGSAQTLGFPPNNYTVEANNIVNYSFASSNPAAPNQYAIFQTHDPWGGTVVKTAITGNGHTFTVFTPAQLAGFAFNTYRVVVLNWDDHFLTDFSAAYNAAIPALQTYVNGGGVLWIQASIQGNTGDTVSLPFGGTFTWELNAQNFIADPASPMMTGVSNPINGTSASHARVGTALPGNAHVVVTAGGTAGGPATLYDLVSVPVELQGFTVE